MVEGEEKETDSSVSVDLVLIEERAAPGNPELGAFPEALTAGAPSCLGEAWEALEPPVKLRARARSHFFVWALELNPLFLQNSFEASHCPL